MKSKLKQSKAQRPLPRIENSRKAKRKQKRLIKKEKRHNHYAKNRKLNTPAQNDLSTVGRYVKRPAEIDDGIISASKNKKVKLGPSVQDTINEERQREMKKERKLQKEMEEQRRKMLLQANEEEDKLIKKLEKQLGMKKIKNKNNLFANDGLDYLLQVCDRSNQEQLVAAQKHLANVDAESDFEDDLAVVTGKTVERDKKKGKKDLRKKTNKQETENDPKDHDIEGSGSDMNGFDEEDKLSHDLDDSDAESEKSFSANETDDMHKQKSDIKDSSKEKSGNTNIESTDDESLLSDGSKDGMDSDFSENDEDSDGNEEDDGEEPKENIEKPDQWEDIYGRKRDKDGNVIKYEKGSYIPPHLRNDSANDDSKEMVQLKRQVKSVLNKLAGTNLHWACTTIESLYNSNSRHSVNTCLTDLWTDALVQSAVTPDRMLAEHAAMVSVLQANVGTEVGAHFLQVLVKKFDNMTTDPRLADGKQLENLTAALAFLYSFKIYEASLMYEMLERLLSRFDGQEGERRVACVLGMLRAAGGTLRKDKPLALRDFVQEKQTRLAKVTSEAAAGSRIKYLLEVLMAVKNNNLTKIPNYDPTYSEHLKKMTKGIIRRGNYVTTLNIGLEDLLKADVRGKWWVVGSAWEGDGKQRKETATDATKQKPGEDAKLLELARKQRMNTDVRRSIFCIIMSAQDYMEAFERLQHLGLKNQQEREIVHVLLACCLQEKTYNPYYAVLANKMCDFDRKMQLAIQYSVWDKIKDLENSNKVHASNLAQFLIHLIMEKALPLSVLKVIEFSDLNKSTVRFMRQILLAIIMNENLQSCLEVFQRISAAPKLHMFRESLRLFIQHFLIRNAGKKTNILSDDEMATLKERTQQVEKILSMHDSKLRL